MFWRTNKEYTTNFGPISGAQTGKASLVFLTASSFWVSAPALGHDEDNHCAAVARSVAEAGFSESVSVECQDGHAVITSDSYPDHALMTGIVATNEQLPVPAVNHALPIPLSPTLGELPQTRDSALAVAVNGVPIFDYTGGGEMTMEDLHHHQARHDTLLTEQLDVCGGHAGRGDDYHYHVKPVCMIEMMDNAGDDAIIGWAFDGFPIYGNNNPDGSAIAANSLDVCNGQADDTFGYRYHTSSDEPYSVQCLMGEVEDFEGLPKIRPLTASAAQGKGGKAAGRPPKGGVGDLVFTEDQVTGLRSMDYTYRGESYFIRYRPSETPNCYEFETKTITNDGEHEAGEYCR